MSETDWGVPETDVLSTIRDVLAENRRAIIATVVDVEGSAYRRPGAKMLVEEDGQGLGHITAGCLEDEVLELTAQVLDADEPRIETYDLMNDEEDVWGLGVGCNGIIDVLLEPIDEAYGPVAEAIDRNERIGVITGLSGDVPLGAKAYYRPGSGIEVESTEFPDWLADALAEPTAELVESGGADTVQIETTAGTAEVFIDGIEPAPSLVVFGSGHDAGPVVELAKKNGFKVTVIGFRGATDLADRFPHADATYTASPATISDQPVTFDDLTYTVVMTHNFIDDRLTVDELVQTPTPYIGLMGPRERFDEMLDEFDAEGRSFSSEELSKVYTPIGLDLGGGSPYQIAHSIVAELLAVQYDRDPGHLRERAGPIHDRTVVEVP